MRTYFIAAIAAAALAAGSAQAAPKTITDPTGDFLGTFTGAHDADLDITSFSVDFEAPFATFLLDATFDNTVGAETTGEVIVLGVDTGAGAKQLFKTGVGSNILFDDAVVIHPDGSASLGGVPLTATILGSEIRLAIPTVLLPSTGSAADHFGFSLWTRNGLGNANQIADIAPNQSLISSAPEPASWALMIAGFGLAGATLRNRRALRSA